jgi:hypothetical protein
MPIDSILVSAVVVAMFVVFAGALIWGERQSKSMNQRLSEGQNARRPSF